VEIPLFGESHAGGFEAPRPVRSGLALAAVGVAPLALGAGEVIRPLSGLVFACIFIAAGALRASIAYTELARLRRSADRELRLGRKAYLHSPLVEWRAGELTSPHNRNVLARSLAHLESEVSASRLPGASPLNRTAVRPHLGLVRQLAARMDAVDEPVRPRGILLVQDLLTSPESSLYARDRAGELHDDLVDCLAALDGDARRNGY
jgi:hypothetical protein